MFDIEVEHANQYITACALVSLNSHIAFDEAWQFEEEQYRRLVRRCRVSDPTLRKRKRVRCASIPSGNWLRSYFVDPAPQGRTLLQTRIKMDDGSADVIRSRIFIPALLKDNPDPEFRRDYEANLKDSPPHIRRALLDGDWYAVAGAFFAAEFIHGVHAIEPYKIVPNVRRRFRSADWGYKNPTVILWWDVDSDGNLTCYRERTYVGMDAAQVSKEIKKEELAADEWDRKQDCSFLTGPIDTQVWEQRGTIGPTMAETFSDNGVWWEKCTKNRLASVQQLMTRLKDRTGENRQPAIRFFNTCRNTIRTLPALATDPNNAELPKDGGEDHWCFAAGTLVDTPRGQVPIESMVNTTGYVYGANGRKTKYTGAALTRKQAATVFVRLDNGKTIRCTPDHRFMISSGEMVPASSLTDAVLYSGICESPSSVPQFRSSTAPDTISAGSISSLMAGDCIALSGSTTTGKFRRAWSFITSITTGRTTKSQTSQTFPTPNTARTTAKASPLHRKTWPKRGWLPLSGTALKRAWNFIANWARRVGRAGAATGSVRYAAVLSSAGWATPQFALRSVSRNVAGLPASTTYSGDAPSVAQHSPVISFQALERAPAPAVRCLAVESAPSADVYCLYVPDGHLFSIEGGIVVSNCDAVLYACMYRLVVPKDDEAPMSGDHDDEMSERRRTARWRNKNGGRYGYGGH